MKNIIIISSLLLSSFAHAQNISDHNFTQSNVEKRPEIDYFKMEVIKTTSELNKQHMYLNYIINELKSLSPNIDLGALQKKVLSKDDIQKQKDIETLQSEIDITKKDLAANQEKLAIQIVEYRKKYAQLEEWEKQLQLKEAQLTDLENQLANQDIELLSQNAYLEKYGKKLAEKEFELEFKTSIIFQQKEEIERLQGMNQTHFDNSFKIVVNKPYIQNNTKIAENKINKLSEKNDRPLIKKVEQQKRLTDNNIKLNDKVKMNKEIPVSITPVTNDDLNEKTQIDNLSLSLLIK